MIKFHTKIWILKENSLEENFIWILDSPHLSENSIMVLVSLALTKALRLAERELRTV